MAQNITSRIEWLSTLSPVNAAVPTEDTKYLRKVSLFSQVFPLSLRDKNTKTYVGRAL